MGRSVYAIRDIANALKLGQKSHFEEHAVSGAVSNPKLNANSGSVGSELDREFSGIGSDLLALDIEFVKFASEVAGLPAGSLRNAVASRDAQAIGDDLAK